MRDNEDRDLCRGDGCRRRMNCERYRRYMLGKPYDGNVLIRCMFAARVQKSSNN